MPSKKLTYAQAIAQSIAEEMRRDPRVLMIGEDIGRWGNLYGATRGLLDEFGEDLIRDTPIAEAGFTGCGIGAALAGLRPIVEILYVDIMLVPLNNILQVLLLASIVP